MNRKKILAVLVLIITLVAGVGITSLVCDFQQIRDGELLSIMSMVVSVVALLVALITYIAIDSVNEITAMEGNVLENPNYSACSVGLIRDYCEFNERDFTIHLINDLDHFTKTHCRTCMELADSIQYVIDRLIWVAYAKNDDKGIEQRKAIIHRLKRKQRKYSKISNGLQYSLNENIKLIEYVLHYQDKSQLKDKSFLIADIREGMIRNPVGKIVYYDYLGLTFRQRAAKLIGKNDENISEFSIEYMTKIQSCKFDEQKVEEIECLLCSAEKAFEQALRYTNGDVLWESYITYNLARVYVMLYLISRKDNNKKKKLLNALSQAVDSRKRIAYIYDIVSQYLGEQIEKELQYAVKLQNNVTQMINKKK